MLFTRSNFIVLVSVFTIGALVTGQNMLAREVVDSVELEYSSSVAGELKDKALAAAFAGEKSVTLSNGVSIDIDTALELAREQ